MSTELGEVSSDPIREVHGWCSHDHPVPSEVNGPGRDEESLVYGSSVSLRHRDRLSGEPVSDFGMANNCSVPTARPH